MKTDPGDLPAYEKAKRSEANAIAWSATGQTETYYG